MISRMEHEGNVGPWLEIAKDKGLEICWVDFNRDSWQVEADDLAAVLSDRAGAVDLLPAIPVSWRGRAIDGLRLPIEQGSISFGLRWHGPRPAVLWEIDAEAPVRVTASAIDPDFSATDAKGETLLNDPGWPRS